MDRPSRRIAERADRVTFHLIRNLEQQIDLLRIGIARDETFHHAPHPAGALAAGRTLSARLVFIEPRQPRDRLHDIGRTIHHDHGRGAQPGLHVTQTVEIHQHCVANRLRQQRHRRTAGDHRQQIVPTAAHAAAMLVDQLAERDTHLLFDVAWLVHVAGYAKELRAGVVRSAKRREPRPAAAQDRRRHRNRLDVVDGRRATIEADVRGERRLQARHALLTLKALQQRRFFTADVSTRSVMNVAIEVPARSSGVLAEQARRVALLDRRFESLVLDAKLAPHVDVASMRAHRERGDQATFQQRLRIVPHDIAVFARTRLRLIRVDHQIRRPSVRLLRHERPLQTRRKARAAASAKTRLLHLIDDPVATLRDDGRRAIPVAALARGR